MPNPSKYFLLNTPPYRDLWPVGGVGVNYALDLLRGIEVSAALSFVTTNSSFESVAVWDIDVTDHETVDGAPLSCPTSINTTNSSGFYQFRFNLQQIRKSDGAVLNAGPYSSSYFTHGIKSETLTVTWDKDTDSLLRLNLEFRKTSGASANIDVLVRDNDSFVSMPWDALRPLRIQQIAYQAMRRVQDIAGLQDARITRERNAVVQEYPSVHLVDVGWEDRETAGYGGGPHAKQTIGILVFTVYTNDGDPIFDTTRLADKVVAALEGDPKRLGLDYVNRVDASELMPLKSVDDNQKEWGIAALGFRIEYRAQRGEI